MPEWQNRLMLGDNLRMLREYVADESVDLIYLDPPFNSNATYNVLFKERSGSASVAQITAFEDTWQWGPESESMYREIMLAGLGKLSDMLQAFRSALGPNDMMAYLVMMAPRLVELRRVLKSTGSLYLHCDPTASHYLKTLVDAVFEPSGFRNEIVWERTSSHNRLVRYGPVHDIILFYTKSQSWQWNPQHMPYDPKYVDAFYRHIEEGTGRRYRLDNITSNKPGGRYLWKGSPPPGKRYWGYSYETMEAFEKGGRLIYSRNGIPQYKRYLDEMPGQLLQDMWTDIPPISSQAKERLGYPTQKPEALLERIIQASSNRGDVVLDPFCGCGTAIAVAERLGRKWIGVDITHLAISLMKSRLRSAYGDDLAPYEVIGSPMDEASARALLAEPDGRYQFQWWACGLIDAHPAHDKKKGADSGIDGYLYFFDDTSNTAKKVVVQVKSGKVNVGDIRDFRGVIEREGAVMGAFITLERPSKPMNVEAASAGFYEPTAFHGLRRFPKIQILTIEALLAGQGLRLPPARIDTYRMAPRREKSVAKKNQLIRG